MNRKKKWIVISILELILISLLIFQVFELLWNYPVDDIKKGAYFQLKRIFQAEDLEARIDIDAYTETLGTWIVCGTYYGEEIEQTVKTDSHWQKNQEGYFDPYEITRNLIGNYSKFRIGYIIPEISYDYAYLDINRTEDYGIIAFLSTQDKCIVMYAINDIS